MARITVKPRRKNDPQECEIWTISGPEDIMLLFRVDQDTDTIVTVDLPPRDALCLVRGLLDRLFDTGVPQ